MRIELMIERLVLDGVPEHEADLVRRSLETSLTRALGSLDPATLRSTSLASARVVLPPPRPSHPAGLGDRLGTALAGAIRDGGGR